MFWSLFIALLLLASAFILWPLRARSSIRRVPDSLDRDHANLTIYQERLAELENDQVNGRIDQGQFDELKFELERNLLADVDEEPDAAGADQAASGQDRAWTSASRLVPLLLLICLPVISYLAYQQWGFRDELALRDLFERTQNVQDDPQQMMSVIEDLSDYVAANPDSGWAWYFLAQNLIAIGQLEPASMALQRASSLIEQPQDKAFLLGRYALNEYLRSGQQMTEQVRDIISQAQRLDPNQMFALQILALDAEQQGDVQGAITYWQRLLQGAPGGEDASFLREHIAGLQAQIDTPDGPEDGSGPIIDVELELAPGLELAPQTRVFVSALDVNGRGQPLAAKALTVGDLPATIRLDNSSAVGPFNLSSAEMVYVVATVSSGGTATVQAGDYQARSEEFQHSGSHAVITLEISDQVE